MHDAPDELVADDPPWWRRHFFIQRDKPVPWWWIAAPLALLLLALAAAIGIPNIEDDLTERTSRELQNGAGIEVGGDVDIDFDGRSGVVTGLLPAGVTAAEVERRLAAIDGVRDIDVSELREQPASEPDELGDEDEPEPVDDEPVPAYVPTGMGLDATARYDGETVTLSGNVLSDAEAEVLRAAAAEHVGAANVVDQLVVADPEDSTDDSVAKVQALATSLAGFGAGVTEASISLSDTDLTYRANALDDDAAMTFEALVGVGSSGLTATGDVVAQPPASELDAQIDELQTELDGLAAEIRETVVFASGGADLSAEAMATLDKAVALINEYDQPVVEVGGHTDDQGDDAVNQSLSQGRAQAVALYLAQAGVDPARVTAVGYGESQPIADNTTEEGRLQNRRVELVAMAGSR